MRERAAQMWLDQLRSNHDRRRAATQRSQDMEEHQRQATMRKIHDQDQSLNRQQQVKTEMSARKTEAYVERQEYLAAAKDHAERVQEHRQQQIDQRQKQKLDRGEELHLNTLATRQRETYERNVTRQHTNSRNQVALDDQRAQRNTSVLEADVSARERVAHQRRSDEEERRRRSEQKDYERRDTHQRSQRIEEHQRQRAENRLREDTDKCGRVLQQRQEMLHGRARARKDKEVQVQDQVAQARAMQDARAKQWENHYDESMRIGRETAEHNRLFKLNNRIMHQLMQETNPNPRRSGRR